VSKLGNGSDSALYWQGLAEDYIEAMKGEYHQHRVEVIKSLIPKELYVSGKNVFDFGCGDGVMFPDFLMAGVSISGADKSAEMLSVARKRIQDCGVDPNSVSLGGPDYLKTIDTASLDGLLSLNVMCYFTDEEEKVFYEEAARIVKPGGYLVVTHSNELFDMFSLNKYTAEFFKKYFTDADISGLLGCEDVFGENAGYNIRENPITYPSKLKKLGFREVKQTFSHRHLAPPALLQKKTYPDTLNVPEDKMWTLMFTCSTYGSCSVRE